MLAWGQRGEEDRGVRGTGDCMSYLVLANGHCLLWTILCIKTNVVNWVVFFHSIVKGDYLHQGGGGGEGGREGKPN